MDERESNKHSYDQFMHTSGRFSQSAKGTSRLFTIYSIKYGIQPLSLLRANGKGESVSRKTGRDRKDTFHGRPVHPYVVPSLSSTQYFNHKFLNSMISTERTRQ